MLAPRNGRWSGFRHLLGARMLELKREKEVVFWVFVFPLLLALGLGFAFRNKPADRTTIAILAGPNAAHILELVQSSPQKHAIRAEIVDDFQAAKGLRLGKYDLIVEPIASDKVQYHYDPARPESVQSHIEVDDALDRGGPQRCVDYKCDRLFRARLTLHRLPYPRPAGYELDELGHVGNRVCTGGHAAAQAPQALCGHTHAAFGFSDGTR